MTTSPGTGAAHSSLEISDRGRDNDSSSIPSVPLDEQILKVVKSSNKDDDGNFQIRPGRVATQLGISMEDANAELCGLLKAVGKGATFTFDQSSKPAVMVFTFPPDFARRARRRRNQEDMKNTLYEALKALIKVVKIITAFGLILSLLILSIAAIMGLIALMVAASRGGDQQHQRRFLSQLRAWFFTIRQLLWCYAMFGSHIEGQDPFMAEMAYDISLLCSVCCGNPGSIFYWMRANQLARRRHRFRRGWGRRQPTTGEEVSLIRRGTWGHEDDDEPTSSAIAPDQEHRGILSVAVEFLFGPIPFHPGPTESQKWKLRAAVILDRCSHAPEPYVTLEQLSPYVDDPPAALSDATKLEAGGLAIVSHFNGIPATTVKANESSKAFTFPELLAESQHAIDYSPPPDTDNGTLQYLLYKQDVEIYSLREQARLPSYLQEPRYKLTQLESSAFQQCCLLGFLNLIGVLWLRASLAPGGVLWTTMQRDYAAVAVILRDGLGKVLLAYAILFWVLPFGRLLLVVVWNAIRARRNSKRADLAYALNQRDPQRRPITASI